MERLGDWVRLIIAKAEPVGRVFTPPFSATYLDNLIDRVEPSWIHG